MYSVSLNCLRRAAFFAAILLATFVSASAAEKASVQGTFVVGGVDAKLVHARAARVPIDNEGTQAVAVLLSARPAGGSVDSWRTADPAKRGSFVVILFGDKGEVLVAELGHAAAKSGRFGVVLELKLVAYSVQGNRVSGHVRTAREESFGDDLFTIDLQFEATIEKE